jgi:hypothetical protein
MSGLMRGSRGGPLGRHDVAAGSKPNLFSTLPVCTELGSLPGRGVLCLVAVTRVDFAFWPFRVVRMFSRIIGQHTTLRAVPVLFPSLFLPKTGTESLE